jgi:hypothetical protein
MAGKWFSLSHLHCVWHSFNTRISNFVYCGNLFCVVVTTGVKILYHSGWPLICGPEATYRWMCRPPNHVKRKEKHVLLFAFAIYLCMKVTPTLNLHFQYSNHQCNKETSQRPCGHWSMHMCVALALQRRTRASGRHATNFFSGMYWWFGKIWSMQIHEEKPST